MYSERATPATVAACIATMLIYSVNLFARDEMTNNESEMIPLLAHVVGGQADPGDGAARRAAQGATQ